MKSNIKNILRHLKILRDDAYYNTLIRTADKEALTKKMTNWVFFVGLAILFVAAMTGDFVSFVDRQKAGYPPTVEQHIAARQRSHAAMEYRQEVLKATPCGSCHWDSKLIINVPEWCDKHGGVK